MIDEEKPLWVLALNAFIGMALAAWMLLTIIPFVAGFCPILPGMDAAFVASCAWAGWNARALRKPAKAKGTPHV